MIISSLSSTLIKTEDKATLSCAQGQHILALEGTPYEMGYQHGCLLKMQVRRNIDTYIDKRDPETGPSLARVQEFLSCLPKILPYIPKDLLEEMKGLAAGSDVPLQKILLLNLFPEMFHCSGITARGEATLDHSLYHVRILDYAIGKNLQSTAILILAKPEGKIPFTSVSYAGFIGCITGMNTKKISVGEIGGQGYGRWEGIPMAFLIRQILETADCLNAARHLLETAKRTCEYYYVVADGKINRSFGCYASHNHIHFIEAGMQYAMFAPNHLLDQDDKFFLSGCSVQRSSHQDCWIEEGGEIRALLHKQPKDTLLLTGFSHAERYPILAERILEQYGSISVETLREIIKKPVSRESNLHTAIFHPSTLEMWVAHAGPEGQPACDEPYAHFSLSDWASAAEDLPIAKG